ncbi:hypothetical protein [Ramlibacter sp.]|uniref:hypothetical protein n=1 Tax=Ramlibacter sp. TaxID=1917967 RepID=UPI003D110053
MNGPVLLALAAAAWLAAQDANAMSQAEYKAQRARVQAAYATAKDRCTSVQGSVRVCDAEARRDYDIARADLRARYRPTPNNMEKAQRMKADGEFRVAVEKCGDLRDGAKALCQEEAKTKWKSAKGEALAERAEHRKQARLEKSQRP